MKSVFAALATAALAASVALVQASNEAARIIDLPGWDDSSLAQYSGYITVSSGASKAQRQLHYSMLRHPGNGKTPKYDASLNTFAG